MEGWVSKGRTGQQDWVREALKKKTTRPGVDKVKPKVWFKYSL